MNVASYLKNFKYKTIRVDSHSANAVKLIFGITIITIMTSFCIRHLVHKVHVKTNSTMNVTSMKTITEVDTENNTSKSVEDSALKEMLYDDLPSSYLRFKIIQTERENRLAGTDSP